MSRSTMRNTLVAALALGAAMNAAAGLFGLGGTSWKEEVLLHDGTRIIVERSVERGGRHEIGQEPPIKEQSLRFTLPGTQDQIIWEDKGSMHVDGANFNLMLLDVVNGTPYVIGTPAGCISYNKWGRPNPPYVIFKHDGKEWQRISLQALPAEVKSPNLLQASPDHEAKKAKGDVVSAQAIKDHHEGYKQPEYRAILRDALPSTQLCPPERTGFKAPYPIPAKEPADKKR